MRYEYPPGRRVNAPATSEPAAAAVDAAPVGRAATSDDLLAYLRGRRPAAGAPRVAVLDDAGVHAGKEVEAARPAPAGPGAGLDDLPPYSPGPDRIEAVFQPVGRHDIPARGYTTGPELRKAAEDGSDPSRRRLAAEGDNEPRRAA